MLEEARAAGNTEVRVYALDALARRAAEQGDTGDALRLAAEADALARTLDWYRDAAEQSTPVDARR